MMRSGINLTPMSTRAYRREIGKHFNEGARLAWAAIERLKISPAEASRLCELKPGSLVKYLYGDQLPARAPADRMSLVLGVPASSWDEQPTEAFVLPALRPPESGSTLPIDADVSGADGAH